MLSKHFLRNQIDKKTLILFELDLGYMPQRVVKGQVLANFFFDHPCLDIKPKSKQDINVVVAKSVLCQI
jgi:hypothetical protein